MSVKTMNKRLDGRLVEMTQVRCALTRFLTEHKRLRVDESESIDDDLSLDRLNGINNDGNSSRCQLFEGLLCVDIDG
jgi:hypothetical protein